MEQIATTRELAVSTIGSHLATAISHREITPDPRDFFSVADEKRIDAAVATTEEGLSKLAPIHAALGGEVPYETLRFYAAFKSIQDPA
jgi:uncharacterized protein YpbB